ncbi:patatin-like phospholipase family protein, partial [Slackia sp.]|uniref:patatin-like phospholipase family protein n=1 Tax=Slackia sp. TaxID=2049041 RepID=UPI002E7A2C3C
MFDENATESIYVDGYTCPVLKRRNGDGHMAQPDTTRTVGLALEGGGYRGMYTAGVLDVWMEHGLTCDHMVGVSAGAAFGYN